jgi:hypothetical protein
MSKQNGPNNYRVEAGQPISEAFSATGWNRAQDAADIVLGARPGVSLAEAGSRFFLLAKTNQLWAKGSSQTVSVYTGPQGEELQTSNEILAWNKFADIASDKFVMLGRLSNGWYVISAEC